LILKGLADDKLGWLDVDFPYPGLPLRKRIRSEKHLDSGVTNCTEKSGESASSGENGLSLETPFPQSDAIPEEIEATDSQNVEIEPIAPTIRIDLGTTETTKRPILQVELAIEDNEKSRANKKPTCPIRRVLLLTLRTEK
jgi:hypothetical protein